MNKADPIPILTEITFHNRNHKGMPGGQEEGEVTAMVKVGVRIKLSSCYVLKYIWDPPQRVFLNSIVPFDFPFLIFPTVPFPYGLIRVLLGVLWLPTWDLKEKDNKEISASEALSWHLSQGSSCMKNPMDNSRSYFKATAVWNRWEQEDKEEWEEKEGKKNEENHCLSV